MYNENIAKQQKQENFEKIEGYPQDSAENRLANARKRLAEKIDSVAGTNFNEVKIPKQVKKIEEKLSSLFFSTNKKKR